MSILDNCRREFDRVFAVYRRLLLSVESYSAKLDDIFRAGKRVQQGWALRGSNGFKWHNRRALQFKSSRRLVGESLESRQMLSANSIWVSGNWVDSQHSSPVYGDVVTAPAGQVAPNAPTLYYGINAFSDVQSGVNNVNSGGTLYVLPGIYQGEVTISQPLTLDGAQAGNNPNQTLPAANQQTILEPDTSDPNPSDQNAVNVVYVASSNVTIDGLTVDGSNPNVAHPYGVTFNGIPIDAADGISSFEGVSNVLLQNNIVKDTSYAGIDFENYGNNEVATSGNTIQNNLIQNLGGGNYGFGIGVLLAYNFYADVKNNDVVNAETGVQAQYFYHSNPGTASISGNDLSVYGTGIFYNLSYDTAPGDTATPIPVSGNSVNAANVTTPTTTSWTGILIASVEGSVNASFTNNTVDGSAATFATTSSGYNVWNTPTTGTVTVQGGTVGGVTDGVWVNNYSGYNAPANATAVSLSGVGITASQIGIYVQDDPLDTSHAAVSATITNCTVTGSGVGVEVSGGHASASLSGSSITGFSTGVEFTTGGSGSMSSTSFAGTSNSVDLLIAATAGQVTIGDGNTFAGSNYYIEDLGSENLDLSGDNNTTFSSFNAATTAVTPSNLATFYGIENKIVDQLDYPSDGYIRIRTGNVFVAHSSESATAGAVQRGINVAFAGDVVNVQAGVYVGEVVISQSQTLSGAQAGDDPNPTAPALSQQTILEPDTSDPNPDDQNAVVVVYVAASNVTIDGVTVSGSNSSLTHVNNASIGGVPIDAADGIASFEGVSNILLQNNILKYTSYAGIDFENYNNNGAATSSNTITNNLLEDLGGTQYDFGAGVLLADNFYAAVTHNVASDTRVGVQTQGYNQLNPGSTNTVSNNSLAVYNTGIFYNLFYAAGAGGQASAIPVSNNQITASSDGSEPDSGVWSGMLITSIFGAMSTSFNSNTINGSAATYATTTLGYTVWNVPATGGASIQGGTVSAVDVGVSVNNFTGYQSAAGATAVAINNLTVTASAYGVYAQDDPDNASHPTVSATISNSDITATGSGIGVEVSGGNATAAVTNSTVSGGAAALDLEGGALSSVKDNILSATIGPAALIGSSATASVVMQNNELSSSGSTVIQNDSTATIDAAENYFVGLATPGVVAPYISGNVNFEPILNAGSNASPFGFQPPDLTNQNNLTVDISAVQSTNFVLNLAPANVSSDGTTLTSWTVTWGDGSTPSYVNLTNPSLWAAEGYNGVDHTLTHAFTSVGTYLVSATATDENGRVATSNVVNAVIATFQVTSFTSSPSGFDVTFNRPANLPVLHLYSSTIGHALYPSDVVVTGPSGAVNGSLVWNSASNTAVWVATAGFLPQGSYSVTLLGSDPSNDVWQDVPGAGAFQLNALTTSSSGTNQTENFTENAATGPTVFTPNFARGPGQPVNVPASTNHLTPTTSGLPISISDGTGVTSVQLTLTYSTLSLTVSGAVADADLPGGWTVVANVSQPGTAILTASGPTPLPSGVSVIFDISAAVPSTATYGSSELIQISGLSINNGAILGTAGEAVHLVAYLGDTTGNEIYTGADASLIRSLLLGYGTGFDAYPLTDPMIDGDVNDNGVITGADASEIRSMLLGYPEPDIPSLPGNNPGLADPGLVNAGAFNAGVAPSFVPGNASAATRSTDLSASSPIFTFSTNGPSLLPAIANIEARVAAQQALSAARQATSLEPMAPQSETQANAPGRGLENAQSSSTVAFATAHKAEGKESTLIRVSGQLASKLVALKQNAKQTLTAVDSASDLKSTDSTIETKIERSSAAIQLALSAARLRAIDNLLSVAQDDANKRSRLFAELASDELVKMGAY